MKKNYFQHATIILSLILFFLLAAHISYRYKQNLFVKSLQEENNRQTAEIKQLQLELTNKNANLVSLQLELSLQKSKFLNLRSDFSRELSVQDSRFTLYQQSYLELLTQSHQPNLLYCKELRDYPVIRTVSENRWNLLAEAYMVNFTHVQLNAMEVIPCSQIKPSSFYYLPTDDTLETQELPPKEGWIEIFPNSEGYYTIPLDESETINECRYVAFKYTIFEHTFYGIMCQEPA